MLRLRYINVILSVDTSIDTAEVADDAIILLFQDENIGEITIYIIELMKPTVSWISSCLTCIA